MYIKSLTCSSLFILIVILINVHDNVLAQHVKACVNQTATWNQEICNPDVTMTYPSYCHYQNPYIVPYPLSYKLFNDSIVDLQACLDKNGNAQHGWNDECYFLNSLSIVEFEGLTMQNQSSRYILFATNRGQLFGSDFNHGNVLLPLIESDNNFEPITKVLTIPMSQGSMGAYIVGLAKQHSLMYYYDSEERNFTQCSQFQSFANTMETYKEIMYMEDNGEIFLLIITEKEILFSKIDPFCNIHEKVFSYEFSNDKLVNVQVHTQHYNTAQVTTSIYVKDGHPYRNLIGIQTSRSIYLIPFERRNKIFINTMNARDLVYRVGSSAVDDATTISGYTLFKEEIIKATGGECSPNPHENYQALYIGVTTYNEVTKISKLILRNLNSWSYERNDDIVCDVSLGEYPVDGKCTKAFENVQYLPQKVTHIKSTFIDLPIEVKEQLLAIIDQYANNPQAAIQTVEPLCEQMAGISTVLNKGETDFMTNYKECLTSFQNTLDAADSSSCSSLLDIIPPDTMEEMMLHHWVHNIFITMDDNSLFIYGAQASACQSSERSLVVREYNQFKLVGRPLELDISPNGQHLFLVLTRKKWEIDAMIRYNEICKSLSKDENNHFFSSLSENCKENPPSDPNIGLFGFSLSYCFPGLYCPHVSQNFISKVDDGFFTERPNYAMTCPKGSFCTNGNKLLCPQGFYCDEEGMRAPKRCMNNDYNCFKAGLQQDSHLPDKGTLTLSPYYPPIPVSNGLFILRMNETRYEVFECKLGEYCPLGREIQFNSSENLNTTRSVLNCPDNTFCSDAHIMTPTICKCNFTYCSYCTNGATEELPCPAGFYCTSPSNKKQCSSGEYCPQGSVIPQVCPAGFYCKVPSEVLECPAGNYCPKGSVVPRPCSFLSICSNNQEHESFNILGFMFVFICSLSVIVIFYSIRVGRGLWNNYIDKKRTTSIQTVIPPKELTESKEKKAGVSIVFDKLSYHVNGKSILNGVTGIIPPSRLTAIMGPSGCGKTTLLSILAGRVYEGSVDGTVYINNTIDSFSNLKKITGFVPQNDIMLPNLTVKETIHFAAKTKLDYRLASSKQASSIISNVIETLGLSHIKHSIIGDEKQRGISGGQKKRVNIGIELAADPKVLFLDEPTSGLDSVSSKEVMFALNRIATEQNVTVVAVIHQPRTEIFEMFHNVILLETGGRMVFNGPSADALPYFENLGYKADAKVNPADFILDVTSGQVVNDNMQTVSNLSQFWETHSSTSDFKKTQMDILECSDYEDIKKENSRRTTLITTQLWLCLRRTIIQFTRSVFDFLLGVTLVYIGGLACGVIFSDGLRYKGPPHEEIIKLCPEPLRLKCSMPLDDPIITMAQIFPLGMALCGVMSSMSIFGDELIVFKREYASGLSTLMYFLAKNIVHIPYIIIYPAIYTSIFYILANPLGSFWEYYGYMILVYNVAVGLGYLLSILLRPSVNKLAGVVVVIITTMLAGARPTIPQMKEMFFPMNILHWLSFLRYSQEIIYLIEIEKYSQIFNVQTSLDIFGYAFGNWWSGVALFSYAIGLRILAYFSLLLVPDTIFIKRGFRWLINRRFVLKNLIAERKVFRQSTTNADSQEPSYTRML